MLIGGACGQGQEAGRDTSPDAALAAKVLRLVYEKKLSRLVPLVAKHYEASGVALDSDRLFVVFDNMTALAEVSTDLLGATATPGLVTESNCIPAPGSRYRFPRDPTGAAKYCTVEGAAFLSRTQMAFVSDKSDGTLPCSATDESIHVFALL